MGWGRRLSIEVDYLRKKATYFQHRQIIGLIMIVSGFIIIFIINFLVMILAYSSAEGLLQLLTYMMASGIVVFCGIVVSIYYSWKLSQFIAFWSRLMEELESRVKEM